MSVLRMEPESHGNSDENHDGISGELHFTNIAARRSVMHTARLHDSFPSLPPHSFVVQQARDVADVDIHSC